MKNEKETAAPAPAKRPYSPPVIEEIGTVVNDTEGSGAKGPDSDILISTPTGKW
jgi:hypothetical protein